MSSEVICSALGRQRACAPAEAPEGSRAEGAALPPVPFPSHERTNSERKALTGKLDFR